MRFDSQKLKAIGIICVKICFIFGALTLIFQKVEFNKLALYVSDLNLFYFLLALLASSGSLIFSALRSRFYFHENGLLMRKRFAIIIYYIGYFFNIVLPGGIGGDGMKVFYLYKLEKFSKITSLRVILYERVNGFYALIVLGFLVFYLTNFCEIIPYSIHLNTALLILVTPVYLWGVKYVLRDKIPTAINAAGYSFIVQFMQVLSAWFLILAFDLLNLNVSQTADFIYLFIIASILTIVPITIGGIGVRELVFLYGAEFLQYQNLDAVVVYAFFNFVVYVLTSIPGAFLLYKVDKIQRLTQQRMKSWYK